MKRFIEGNYIPFMFFLVILVGCSPDKKEEASDLLEGEWIAQWDTDPSSFPEVPDASIYTMNGNFRFQEDEVTVTAFGFPGCIFSTDTLSHTLNWNMSNDTLSLVNDGDIYGMTYRVLEMKDKQVRLQLMDDITVTLLR
ncbi:MAG: hypothetical protein RIF33_23945 [Cyclobacteriaceae bacterium]